MGVSEERLREIIREVLCEQQGIVRRRDIWMVCMEDWDERYHDFLVFMKGYPGRVFVVVPDGWDVAGYWDRLCRNGCRAEIVRRKDAVRRMEDPAITVFPVVPRDLVVKTALCIGDTFETSWIGSCIEQGSMAVFLRSGLERFSGREPRAYVERILEYYREVLMYGVGICDVRQIDDLGEVIV
ncbi:MAG: hypothetical protein ACRDBO_09370 [Lachnospiraceae bacterium]